MEKTSVKECVYNFFPKSVQYYFFSILNFCVALFIYMTDNKLLDLSLKLVTIKMMNNEKLNENPERPTYTK